MYTKEKKTIPVSVRLNVKEIEFLESKIQKKEYFLESVCKVPHIKISPAMVLREFLWEVMKKEGVS